MDEKEMLEVLQELGDMITEDMRVIIELNGSIATGTLYNELQTQSYKTNDGNYSLAISYPFYGKFIDEGRNPSAKMPPLDAIKEWTRIKGIPEDAAYPIAKKIQREGYEGINFTEPFYEDLGVIKEIITEEFANQVIKVLVGDKRKRK